MNDQQENRLSRAEKVETFLLQHKDDLKATPAVTATLLPQLSTAIEKMRSDDEKAVADNTGYGESKEETETALENMTDHIGSAIESYADDEEDFVLQNSVEFTLSQIQGFRDNRLIQYAQFVLDTAMSEAIKPSLIAEHNIKEEDINSLKNLIDKYTMQAAQPLQKKGEAVAWGKLVDRDLADIDAVLNKVRRKMNTYRYTNRFLFDAFTAVDNIDDTGSHKGKEETIAPGETVTVATFLYNAATSFSLVNTGTTGLSLAMYKNGSQTGTPVLVMAGNKASGTLSELGTDGDELRISNQGNTTGGYKFDL